MYVRDAKNREEVWLLEQIESMELDDTAFRSRDYVVAIDENSGTKAGFGRIRVHKGEVDVCELTSIGVLEEWRGQGVGAHVIERLLEYAGDDGFEAVYALTGEVEYLMQFGFRPIEEGRLPAPLADRLEEKREETDPNAVPLRIEVGRFRMPERLREAFKRATARQDDEDDGETAEDFGIDPDSATYKYDTGR
ncbi:GNAT family N-acetyltransferase [Natrialbaceae archaeon AArc-T1-2]|uniref:GNAT family N-acetyltransferase n=1 Tax=Natrialbaceae archaeon AArc-T1-2 TaxID=3053904 RepID=UPI00255B280F|nr:GNAT family N-acetyltransferase [Natrialbaceae archaeon AArc-T1-2]WIV67958.1 GNAT family N-acetyltransferase [Natrialbaceae archaeon AArc-T1-2]